jgi:hypothetical protein
MESFEKVHLWLGTTYNTEEEYQAYFELDLENDLDSPNYKNCQFCKDVGDDWYDEDFIGIIPRLDKEVGLDEILEDSMVSIKDFKKVKKVCSDYGIEKVNAIFGIVMEI